MSALDTLLSRVVDFLSHHASPWRVSARRFTLRRLQRAFAHLPLFEADVIVTGERVQYFQDSFVQMWGKRVRVSLIMRPRSTRTPLGRGNRKAHVNQHFHSYHKAQGEHKDPLGLSGRRHLRCRQPELSLLLQLERHRAISSGAPRQNALNMRRIQHPGSGCQHVRLVERRAAAPRPAR